jgi:antitoxin component YwqK of YwqJK toxin-antitoxin module
MKENIIECYPNGEVKHKIKFYDNGRIWRKQYYDQNGEDHREDYLPDFYSWDPNGYTALITYYIHGGPHNINNPSCISFDNGKIMDKRYSINDNDNNKLQWLNQIKNI